MTEYWVKVDISRQKALQVLDELADPRSQLRKDLQKSKRSAQAALSERGIEVATASLPDRIRLPAPEQVAALRTQARAIVAKDRRPFGFFILAVCFGAMPLVDAPN
jgi:hypothetical protein